MRRLVVTVLASVALLGIGSPNVRVIAGGQQSPAAPAAPAARAGRLPAIADKTDGMRKLDGFFPLYWDEPNGALYLEIPKLDTEVLYQTGIGAGMGSNDIGLDRGLLVDTRIVSFQRVGPKVLMVQPNYDYR